MSELMAIGYPGRDQATVVINTMRRLEIAWLERNDIAVLVRDKKGKLQMSEPRYLVRGRAMPWSVLWREILRSSMASANGLSTVVSRPASAVGIPDTFVREVSAMVTGVESTLIIWVRTSLPHRVSDYLCATASNVLKAQLDAAQEALLLSVLDVLGPSERQGA